MQNRMKFAENMAGLGEAFGTEITELKGKIYWQVLDRFSDDQVERAILESISTLKFFPKPAELIELIEGKSEEKSLVAWDELLTAIQRHGSYASVRFEDAKITKAVELMGGWLELCSMTEDETKFRRAEFQKIYSSLRGEFPPKTLAGRYELDNAMRGFHSAIPDPIMIGHGHKPDAPRLEAP
jgi:hypothetical protein